MVSVTKDTFQSEVLDVKGTVLVDFWAGWCGPCMMIAPILEEIDAERQDIKVAKVNVDEQMELAMQYKVSSIPTLLVFKDGELVTKSVGAQPKEALLDLIG